MRALLSTLVLAAAAPSIGACQESSEAVTRSIAQAAAPLPDDSPLDRLVLAGGCFWCTEAVFEELAGVSDVVSGYAGGTAEDADYKRVSSGKTDHAEVIQVTYDPKVVAREQLLDVFFAVAHDPTQLDRQGPDWGRQYRSSVFYADEEERAAVEAFIQRLTQAKAHKQPIVTKLEPLVAFFPAEPYHQDFVARNPRHGYVAANALPKVKKLKQRFAPLLKKKQAAKPE